MNSQTEPEDFLFEGAQVYEDKNDDYGDSWRQVGRFMKQLAGPDGITLETEEDFISFGLFTRRLDKLARAFNGEFLSDEMNFESIIDAHQDESVYAAMAASNQSERDDESTLSNVSKDEDTCEGRTVSEEPAVGIDHPTTDVRVQKSFDRGPGGPGRN